MNGLISGPRLMDMVASDRWVDAELPSVLDYLESNKHCFMPPVEDWAG